MVTENATVPGPSDLRAVLAGMPGPHVTERSVKLSPGKLSADRFLATCQPTSLGPSPGETFARLADWLGCHPADRDRLLKNFDRVLTVHFGYDGIDPPLFKLYAEYPLGESGRMDMPSDTLFLAAKWLPAQRAYFSHYRFLDRPRTGIETRDFLAGDQWPDIGPASRAFADRVLSELILPQGRVDVMLVEDEGRPRRSYDINLYRVDTPLRRHAGAIAALCRAFGLDGAEALILKDGEGTILGHVAVGVGADGAEFVTLYYARQQHVPR